LNYVPDVFYKLEPMLIDFIRKQLCKSVSFLGAYSQIGWDYLVCFIRTFNEGRIPIHD
jgi:hypothetical protein